MSFVSVVVVTWNGLHVLRDCVAALAGQTVPHELIVVDNGSRDGTVEWLRNNAPHAHVVPLPHNLGFAAGNNAGLRAATGELLVLLNNDTIAAPDFLEQLAAPFTRDKQLAAAAGVLLFAHRPEFIASAGISVGRDGLHRDLWMLRPAAELPDQTTPVFGASGGAACYRRAALEDVGLLDERYGSYLEDADLAWRLRLAGWGCVSVPQARVLHVYSATASHGSPFKQRLQARNRVRVLVRCLPIRLWEKHWAAIMRYDLLAIAYAMLRRQPALIAGRLDAIRDMPALLGQRRRLAKRKRVPGAALERWLEPSASVREILRQQRDLDAVLRARQM